ncbi:Uncharacterized damage-inducible protein DinB (forms a four-helix bundle) [Mucilaginibacter lappiensis]|uniref:Damage-inducible protein DinB n=1 Tax=Mucilaginibacter lappiensis TaxID=354630 RepID=A0ABR6PND0_9SPHI|nr:DinB family protein [Mucilaginibacter lappiensis]MBB6111126.1 putative damage-inducible protein DinB [Mucilaginibacter lappiensis]SIR69828.1 Uncharacterized damage-inducible protein DinB (forms a four-helix bundle) [Mucilaginibacter lappiensis]
MKKLTLLFTLMATIFACTTVRAQITNDQMVAEWQRAKNYTKAYLDAMPDDGYSFKPTPEMRSFAGQMLHLADDNYFFSCWVSGKTNPLGKTSLEKTVEPTKAATIKAVMDSYDFVISAIPGLTPAQLQETIKVGEKNFSKFLILSKGFEHQTHHRGQATVYLRLKGVKPPQEMLF